jgi:hypothetical protein
MSGRSGWDRPLWQPGRSGEVVCVCTCAGFCKGGDACQTVVPHCIAVAVRTSGGPGGEEAGKILNFKGGWPVKMLPKLSRNDVRSRTELLLYLLRNLFADKILIPDIQRLPKDADDAVDEIFEIKCFLDVMSYLKLVLEKECITCTQCGKVLCALPDPAKYNFKNPDDRAKFSEAVYTFYRSLGDMVDLHGHIYCQKCQDMYINDMVDTLGLDSHFYALRKNGVIEVL